MAAKNIQADYLIARMNTSAHGLVLLLDKATFDSPIRFDACPISIQSDGYYDGATPIIRVSPIITLAALTLSDNLRILSIDTDMSRSSQNSISTSLAVVKYCERASPLHPPASIDTVVARRVVLEAAQDAQMIFSGPSTFGAAAVAQLHGGIYTLPAPEMGRVCEFIADICGLCLMNGGDVVYGTTTPGAHIIAVSNGVRWFALNEDVQ